MYHNVLLRLNFFLEVIEAGHKILKFLHVLDRKLHAILAPSDKPVRTTVSWKVQIPLKSAWHPHLQTAHHGSTSGSRTRKKTWVHARKGSWRRRTGWRLQAALIEIPLQSWFSRLKLLILFFTCISKFHYFFLFSIYDILFTKSQVNIQRIFCFPVHNSLVAGPKTAELW